MYVCICKAVTERQIDAAHANGARSVRDLMRTLQVGTQCRKCLRDAGERLKVLNSACNEPEAGDRNKLAVNK